MFPAISDFIQTNLADNLKNFLQPAFVTVASIFMVLNLVFIFPMLIAYGDYSVITNLLNLDVSVQVLLAAIVILVLAYLLLSLNNFTLKLMNGELWSATFIGFISIQFQKMRRNRLRVKSDRANVRDLINRLELVTNFPDEDAYLSPTALGNVLNATSSYIWKHYGIDMVALWSHMQTAVGNNDNSLSKRVNDEKTTLDFLVNLTFMLLVFAVEYVLFLFFFRQVGLGVLWALLPAGFAIVIYWAAVGQARTWGDVVQMAFDLHRDDLKKNLGLRDFTSEEDERQVWIKVSKWLLWGNPADEVFTFQPTTTDTSKNTAKTPTAATHSPVVKTLANVQTDIQSTIRDLAISEDINTSTNIQKIYQHIDYVLIVSNNSKSGLNNIYIYFSDTRLPEINEVPKHELWHDLSNHDKAGENKQKVTIGGKVVPQNKVDADHQILWHIDRLAAHSAIALFYSLPSRIFKVTTGTSQNLKIALEGPINPSKDIGAIDYTFNITKESSPPGQWSSESVGEALENTIIEVLDNRRILPDYPKFGCVWADKHNIPRVVEAKRLSKPDRYRWELGTIKANDSVTLEYTL